MSKSNREPAERRSRDKTQLLHHYQEPPEFPPALEPEQRLCAAMILRAYYDIQPRDTTRGLDLTSEHVEDVRDAAADWLNYDGDEPWSYRWCCYACGISAEGFRSRLEAQGWFSFESWGGPFDISED